jgi:hypothetical protein
MSVENPVVFFAGTQYFSALLFLLGAPYPGYPPCVRHRFTSLGPLTLLANMALCGAIKTLEADHPQTATGPCFSERVTSTPLLTSKGIKKAKDRLPAWYAIFAER